MPDVLDQKLESYFVQLNDAEKKSILLLLKTFLATRTKNEVNISLEQYNYEIDEALAEADAEDYISQDEMEQHAARW